MHDVLIIGSGAGGGSMALRLSQAGLRVLVLEKGPRFSREDYRHSEGGLLPGQFVPPVDQEPHTVVTRKTTNPVHSNLGWIATCVGGGTVHMGAYFYRFHPDDFRMRSRFGEYLEIADWPYGYDELEPYYAAAERELGVSGQAVDSPFMGPRSSAFPMPPLRAHDFAERVECACRDHGLEPVVTPRAINSREYGDRPECAYCSVCASWGCPVGARGTSQEALLPRAEATGRCEVRPLSMVTRVLTSDDGRATGCIYLDAHGVEHRVSARLVCISASAIESARLLLMSTSSLHPDGLGNRHGNVGRHLQFHAVSMGQARFDLDQHPILSDPHPFLGRSVMDHYFLPPGVSDIDKGGVLRFALAPQVAHPALGPVPGLQPTDGSRLLYFEAFHDFLPNVDTRVSLDPEVTDRWGLPVARIHLDRPVHHMRAGQFLCQQAFAIYHHLGAVEMVATDVGGTSSYLVHGTCRAGDDPKTSVLDAYCRVHDVPNLYVVDGSFMPTSGGSAPTLTLVANSLRTADHVVGRFRSGDFDRGPSA